jgi:hypothetical protein
MSIWLFLGLNNPLSSYVSRKVGGDGIAKMWTNGVSEV